MNQCYFSPSTTSEGFRDMGNGVMTDGHTVTSSFNKWKMIEEKPGEWRYPETQEEWKPILEHKRPVAMLAVEEIIREKEKTFPNKIISFFMKLFGEKNG